MASLLDQVLDNKDNPSVEEVLSPKDDHSYKLSDGSVVYESTISAINRILGLNPHLYKKRTLGGYELFNGRDRINLGSFQQILSLIRGDWKPVTDWQVQFLREKVVELAPEMSFSGYLISDGLFWDKEKGELKRIEKDGTIRTTL